MKVTLQTCAAKKFRSGHPLGGRATVSSEKDTTQGARTPISVSRIIWNGLMQKEGKLIFKFKHNNLDM